ncbi:hypothetical protein T01_5387, partial [Trichinella spiralis]
LIDTSRTHKGGKELKLTSTITIRLVDVVETRMLFQECEVLTYVITTMCSGDAQLLLVNQVI